MNLRRLSAAFGLVAILGLSMPAPASATLVQIDPAYSTIKFDVTTNTVKATTADGADVAQGATADAACATDNGTCTIEAVLKRVAQRLTTLNTTLGTPMQATGGTVAVFGGTAVGSVPGTAPVYVGGRDSSGNIRYISVDTSGNVLLSGLSGQIPVGGNASAGSADSGAPAKIGCKYNAASVSFADGNRTDCQSAENGGLIVALWAAAANRWNFASATSGITNTTTAVTIKTAAGASVRNYIDGCQVDHDTLGAATELAIRDGAAGTVLWRRKLQTTAQEGASFTFESPIKGTANTLLEVVTLTAVTGGVFVNCQGHTGP